MSNEIVLYVLRVPWRHISDTETSRLRQIRRSGGGGGEGALKPTQSDCCHDRHEVQK